MDRKTITNGLTKAANSYFLRRGYSCTNELGIAKWGKYKVDMLGMNMRGDLVICEVKSSVADFTSDDKRQKWVNYLPSCHRFYWVLTEDLAEKLRPHFPRFAEHGCGVLVLDRSTGYLRCIKPARRRKMLGKEQRHIIIRLAWRAGDVSKRNSRRTRIFLEDTTQ